MGGWRNRITKEGIQPASRFLVHPQNWRKHPKHQQEALRAILDDVGWVQRVIVNANTGFLLDGHKRIAQAMQNGDAEVPYLEVDLAPEEERLILASLDPLSALAETDVEKLSELLAVIESDNEAIEEMLRDLAKREKIDIGYEPAPDLGPRLDKAEELREKWGVEMGQLWRIGEHRLVCGDCTDEAVVARVMGGELARAIVTDPPYGIGKDGIANDDPGGIEELYRSSISLLPAEDAIAFAFLSPRLYWMWYEAAKEAGWFNERLLWLYRKQAKTYPWRSWALASDAIMVMSKGEPTWGEPSEYKHDTYVKTELEASWLTGLHTTIKPSWVVEHLVSSTMGIVYDPFLGSGTTMVACERLGRKCRGIEIEPTYVAVAIQRWVDMTGGEPKHEGA